MQTNSINNVIRSLAEESQQGTIAWFAGAGISMDPPSSLPGALDLILYLADLVTRGNGGQRDRLFTALKPFRLELALDVVRPSIRQSVLEQLESQNPNAHHRMIAASLQSGNSLLTTNFDTLVEQAAEDLCPDFRLIIPFVDKDDNVSIDGAVIKLHGSLPFKGRGGMEMCTFSFRHFLEFPHLDLTNSALLEKALKMKRIIFVGYSGGDDFDLMPKFRSETFKYPPVWVRHVKGKPPVLASAEPLNEVVNELIVDKNGILIDGDTGMFFGMLSDYLKELPTVRLKRTAVDVSEHNQKPSVDFLDAQESLANLYALTGDRERAIEIRLQRRFDLLPEDYEGSLDNYTSLLSILTNTGPIEVAKMVASQGQRIITEAGKGNAVKAETVIYFQIEVARLVLLTEYPSAAHVQLIPAEGRLAELPESPHKNFLLARLNGLIASIELADHRPKEALARISEAMDFNRRCPEYRDPEYHYRLYSDQGLALFRMGHEKEALDVWNNVIDYYRKVGKRHELALLTANAGFAAAKLGDYDEALRLLREADGVLANLSEDNPVLLMMLSYRLAILCWNVERHGEESEHYIRRVREGALLRKDSGLMGWCDKAAKAVQSGENIEEQGAYTIRFGQQR